MALVRVPFYFINLLPTSLLYIPILLVCLRLSLSLCVYVQCVSVSVSATFFVCVRVCRVCPRVSVCLCVRVCLCKCICICVYTQTYQVIANSRQSFWKTRADSSCPIPFGVYILKRLKNSLNKYKISLLRLYSLKNY
jgi:hypothetical protein